MEEEAKYSAFRGMLINYNVWTLFIFRYKETNRKIMKQLGKL